METGRNIFYSEAINFGSGNGKKFILKFNGPKNPILIKCNGEPSIVNTSYTREQVSRKLGRVFPELRHTPGYQTEELRPEQSPACANCLAEQGIKPNGNGSHGLCERHENMLLSGIKRKSSRN